MIATKMHARCHSKPARNTAKPACLSPFQSHLFNRHTNQLSPSIILTFRPRYERLSSNVVARSKVLQGLDIPLEDDREPGSEKDAAQRAVQNAAETSQPKAVARMLQDICQGGSIPDPYFGPLTLSRVKGKGWGMIATSLISAGDVIMVSEPLAFVRGPVNLPPLPQELLDEARRNRYSPTRAMLYGMLFLGQPRDMDARAPRLDALMDYDDSDDSNGLELKMDDFQLADVLNYNAYGDGNSDLLLAKLRDQDPFSFIGLWPEFSFLNHSCAPNAVQVVVGQRMVVRATQDIAPKEEVTINYLGASVLAPLPSREQDLEAWGFTCNCVRCRNERRFQPSLGYMMAETGNQLMQLTQLYEEALTKPSAQGLDDLETKLLALAASVEESMMELAPDPSRLLWLRASVFDIFNLLAHVRRMKDPYSEESLASRAGCVQILESVAAGSDFHMLLTCQFVDEVNRVTGGQASDSQQVQQLAFNAVKARYGPVDEETLQRILLLGAKVVQELNASEQETADL